MSADARNSKTNVQLGRFIVKGSRDTYSNLPAHEVEALIERHPNDIAEIFRIHRVHENGQMDLVGVSPAALRERDVLLFLWDNVVAARRDYDALVGTADRVPPPCRIELRLVHAKNYAASHVVALVFPLACGEGVGQWLSSAEFRSNARMDASPMHRARFEAAVSQVILSATLEPSQVEE